MSTMTTTRSTKAITTFVIASRELATIAARQKELTREMESVKVEVLDQIGEGRSVVIDRVPVILTPRVKQSFSRTCDDQTAVEFCKSHGLKYSERTPEYVAPASFSAYCKAGQMLPDLYEMTETVDVNVI